MASGRGSAIPLPGPLPRRTLTCARSSPVRSRPRWPRARRQSLWWHVNAGGAQAAASEPYTWKNVRIDGGGFVPGIIFNQTEQNLIYARTDIGGAYRWNQAASTWIPLLDWVGWNQLGLERRGQPRHRPGADQPGVRRGRHVHQQLGPQQRRHPALDRQGRHLAVDRAAVQARRQHARPRHGRAARGRPEPQQRSLYFGAAERQRPVAQHRLRRDLGQGDQLPQRRQLRAGPGRPRTYG